MRIPGQQPKANNRLHKGEEGERTGWEVKSVCMF